MCDIVNLTSAHKSYMFICYLYGGRVARRRDMVGPVPIFAPCPASPVLFGTVPIFTVFPGILSMF